MMSFETALSSVFLTAFFHPKTLVFVCTLILGLIIFLILHVIKVRKSLAKVTEDLFSYKELFTCLPDGFYVWKYDSVGFIGRTFCSHRLAVMLNLFHGQQASFEMVLERFCQKSAVLLSNALSDLRQNHDPFVLELHNRDETQCFLVSGFQALHIQNKPLLDVIWIKEITQSKKNTDMLNARLVDLEKTQSFFKQALDSFPFPVWLRNEDLDIMFCNTAYARAVHADSCEQAVRLGGELVYEKSPREARVLAAAARASGKEHKAREFVVMNGKRRRVEVSEIPLPHQTDSFRTQTLGFVRDMTLEQELQDALGEHITSHNGVLEHLKTAVVVFDLETRLRFYNTSFLKLWDLEEEWLDGAPFYGHFLDLLREKRRLPENRDFAAYKNKENAYFSTLVSAQEDLLFLPNSMTLRRMLIPHPLGGLLMTFEDVTGHFTLERSMSVLNETQIMLINQMREGVLLFENNGRLRLMNTAYERLWHVTNDMNNKNPPTLQDVIEKQALFFEKNDEWSVLKEQILSVIFGHTGEMFQILRPDDKVLEFCSILLPDGGTLVSFFDVSAEEKSASLAVEKEMLLTKFKQTTAQADKLRATFLDQMSAEMRSHLSTLTTCCNSLLKDKKPAKTIVETILNASTMMTDLFADLADLALIETGSSVLELDSIDLKAFLSEIIKTIKPRAKNKDVILEFDCDQNIPALIADKKRLKQVIYYLINNALLTAFKKGTLSIKLTSAKHQIILIVAEASLDLQPAQETPAFVAQQGVAEALIKNVIEMHRGTLSVSDKNGVKETTITLPIHGK